MMMSDLVQFPPCTHTYDEFSGLTLKEDKKKPIGFMGSSYHSQEVLNITNVNKTIKILVIYDLCFLLMTNKRE